MSAPNAHRVPLRQWRRWSEAQREMFNALYDRMRNNPTMFRHRDAELEPMGHWEVTAWNAAWVAADELKHVTGLRGVPAGRATGLSVAQ